MSPIRKAVLAAAMVGSTFVGGAMGAALLTGSSASATSQQTTPTTAPAPSAPAVTPSGGFHSNESATHEAGESAAREAQENAGQVPTVP